MDAFTLTIELGNDAMRTNEDIASALDRVREQLLSERIPSEGPVRDENGNTVGRWEVRDV